MLVFVRALTMTLLIASALSAADATYDGARVHYESYGKGADAIVFIHGWTCDLTFWRGQAPVYERHRSLLVDLPGTAQAASRMVRTTRDRSRGAVKPVCPPPGSDRAVVAGTAMGGPLRRPFLRVFPAK